MKTKGKPDAKVSKVPARSARPGIALPAIPKGEAKGQGVDMPGPIGSRDSSPNRLARPAQEATPEVIVGESGPSQAGWHSVQDFLTCMKEGQLRHVRGIRKPLANNPDYFSIGSALHAGRARWFTLKFATDEKAWVSIQDAVRKELEAQKLPTSLKAEQDAMKYLQEYVDHWSKRPKPTPIATEYLIGPAPVQPNDPFFFYRTAKLDDISKYPEAGGALCIGETKSTSTTVNDCINQYTLHGQTLLQLVLWKSAPQGEATFGPVQGIMLDIIKKGYGNERSGFARQFLPITDISLAWYRKSMAGYLRAISQIDWNADAPRNITACTRLVGRARVACEFRELCQHGRSASIKYVLRDGESLLTWKPTDERKVPPWE